MRGRVDVKKNKCNIYKDMEKQRTVPLEDLKTHLEGIVTNLKKNGKVSKENERALNAVLDVYLWAKDKSENV